MSCGWYCRSLVRIWFNCREVFQNQIPRPLLVEHSWGSAWSSSALYSSPSPPSSFAWSSQLATFSTPSISAKASRSTPPVSPSPIWSWGTKSQNFQKIFLPGSSSTEDLLAALRWWHHETWWTITITITITWRVFPGSRWPRSPCAGYCAPSGRPPAAPPRSLTFWCKLRKMRHKVMKKKRQQNIKVPALKGKKKSIERSRT